MYKLFVTAAMISLTAGCATKQLETNHQETLGTLKNIESKFDNKLEKIESQLNEQDHYIYSLEQEMLVLRSKVDSLTHLAAARQAEEHAKLEQEGELEVAVMPRIAPINAPVVLGSVEKVTINDIDTNFDARIDTGAQTSSINASDIQEFERNGKRWVRFHMFDETQPELSEVWIESPVIRFAKIRQSTSSETERRAVVELWVKLGAVREKAQFTLADRSHMSHPVLLGREFIKDIALVDVSKQFIHSEEN
ncbi:ATP-dependent zinc protease [Vibrio maerlii]|uniref:ATP-dependent zinc protease family protein n=1 Tax=Vibrio maerlii TaxID=2231648 RepID=UPI000E3C0DF1|nr:ATP-dependent zinc protease [Vibrio maerlii]